MNTSILTSRRKLTKARVRAKISGTTARPRMSVFISKLNVTAQLIDDTSHSSLVYVSTVGQKELANKNMTDKAQWVGEEIARKANEVKITEVVFDRGRRIYHGRVKQLADAARKSGLKF